MAAPGDLSLASHRLRLERAEYHLDALEREIRVWIDVHRPFPKTAFDPETGIHVVSFELPVSVPNDVFGPLIGDVLHNLRSALDHLAYELAVAYSGDLSEEMAAGSEFPIFLNEPKTDDPWEKRIRGIAPEAQAIIKGLQPYHPRTYPIHGLEALYLLSNIDKHRRPALSAFSVGEIDLWPFDDSVEFAFFEPGEPGLVEYGTPHVFARFQAVTKEKVEMGHGFTYDIAFSEPTALPEGARVLEVLYGIKLFIGGAVFHPLEPFL